MLIAILLLVVALFLWPVWLLLGIFLIWRYIGRSFARKHLLQELQQTWSAQGRRLIFFTTNGKHWKAYFEKELLPRLQGKAQIVNWSTRQQDGWKEASLEARIIDLYGRWPRIAPSAFVLLPSGALKAFFFHDTFRKFLKSGKPAFKEQEAELVSLLS